MTCSQFVDYLSIGSGVLTDDSFEELPALVTVERLFVI